MNWRALFETLGAAAAVGAGDAAVTTIQGGELSAKKIGTSAAVGALVAIINLYRQPPKPTIAPADPPKS